MRMLCQSVEALKVMTGDVPPTPPASRPTTPKAQVTSVSSTENKPKRHHRRTPSNVPSDDIKAPTFKTIDVGSPAASATEPIIIIGEDSVSITEQSQSIARKFFSKTAPTVTMEEYTERLQRYCPMSSAVWLAAGCYIYRLAVEDQSVPVTSRTVNRLVLASLRIAMKALEDVRFPHERFAGVGGVRQSELATLEVSFCYLMDFDLYLTKAKMLEKTLALRDATRAGRKLPSSFQPRLPMRNKTNLQS